MYRLPFDGASSLCGCCTHNAPLKPVRHSAKPVLAVFEVILEQIVSGGILLLLPSYRPDRGIVLRINWALAVCPIATLQTALMERVFAQEVDCWKV